VVQLEHSGRRVSRCPYVHLSVRAITFELHDHWPRYLTSWFNLALSMSDSKVRVLGQSSRSREEKFLFRLWMQSIDWIVGKTSYGAVRKNAGADVSVTRRRYAEALDGCLSSSLCWSGRCELEWGHSSWCELLLLWMRVSLRCLWASFWSLR